jgi:membrane protease YdiL (CAAX protease family)
MGSPLSFGWVEVVTWTLGALLFMAVLVGFAQSARPDVTSDMVTLSGTSSVVFLALAAILSGRYSSSGSALGALGVRRLPVFVVLGSLLLGVLAQFPALFVARLTEQYFPMAEAEMLERTGALRGTSPLHSAALAIFLALLVPFTEEAFFRGAMFGAVRRAGHSSRFAAASTGTAFVMSHLDPRYWPALGLVAFGLSLLRSLSGSLLPSLAFHIGFNAYTVALTTYRLGGESGEFDLPWQTEAVLVLASVVVALGLFFYLNKSERCRGYRELETSGREAD